eukprot:gnl/Spiro4/9464_TR5010_c0_g3_i1.p1 gnl/Spiro4/9464_TR5010_c0_g3~~gnl/Spiro4/9464_TR5010_c0_g3_i1.p1  ORF type:complete len:291 (-),score=56.37 gnl/Spiro4/9464_TR5010_c0_g3_i1:153-1025(-)
MFSSAKGGEVYTAGDTVLAYHGPMLYESLVMKVEEQVSRSGTAETKYFVHYKKWSRNYDEWISAERILPINRASLKMQKDLQAHLEQISASSGGVSAPDDVLSQPSRKRRRIDAEVEPPSNDYKREVRVGITTTELKTRLVDDWIQIKDKKLVPLPRTPSVSNIFDNFLRSNKKKRPASEALLVEAVEGLRAYFDRCLPTILLYRCERPQFEEVRAAHPELAPSQIYGAEHLLRLFVKLPTLLANTSLEEDTFQVLQQKLSEFIRYLEKHQFELFCRNYVTQSETQSSRG